MELQPPALQIGANPLAPLFKSRGVVMEQRKVVDVAQVSARPQYLLAEVIEPVEIDVGEKLTGQVADGKPPAALEWCQQVVAGIEDVDRLLRVGAFNDPVHQDQRAFAGDAAAQIAFE